MPSGPVRCNSARFVRHDCAGPDPLITRDRWRDLDGANDTGQGPETAPPRSLRYGACILPLVLHGASRPGCAARVFFASCQFIGRLRVDFALDSGDVSTTGILPFDQLRMASHPRHKAAEIRVGTGRTGRDCQAGQVEKSGSMASLIAIGWHPADQQTATLCQGFGNDHRDT
jgi:hypothetical protein